MIQLNKTNTAEVESREPRTAKDVIIRVLMSILMVVLGINFGTFASRTGIVYIPLKLLELSTNTAMSITFAVMSVAVTACYIIMMKLRQYRLYTTSFYIPFMLFNILIFIIGLTGGIA